MACEVHPVTPGASPRPPQVEVVAATFTRVPTLARLARPTETLARTGQPGLTPTLPPADVPATRAPAVAIEPLAAGAAVDPPTAVAVIEPTQTAAPAGEVPPPAAEVAAAEQHTIDLINAERVAAGVAGLVRDEMLMRIARTRVADMVARGYTGHTDPVTGEYLARAQMRAAGYASSYLGENWYGSGLGLTTLPEVAVGWFMGDPPHAQNILNPNYTSVGVGIAYNGELWLLVQNFAGQ